MRSEEEIAVLCGYYDEREEYEPTDDGMGERSIGMSADCMSPGIEEFGECIYKNTKLVSCPIKDRLNDKGEK